MLLPMPQCNSLLTALQDPAPPRASHSRNQAQTPLEAPSPPLQGSHVWHLYREVHNPQPQPQLNNSLQPRKVQGRENRIPNVLVVENNLRSTGDSQFTHFKHFPCLIQQPHGEAPPQAGTGAGGGEGSCWQLVVGPFFLLDLCVMHCMTVLGIVGLGILLA